MNISGFGDQLLTRSALGINDLGLSVLVPLTANLFDFHPFMQTGSVPLCPSRALGSEGCSPGITTPAAPTLQFGSWGFHGPPALPSPPQSHQSASSLCDVVWAGFLRRRGTGRGIWVWLVGGGKVFFVSLHSRLMFAVQPL